jgi:hypothetical protein
MARFIMFHFRSRKVSISDEAADREADGFRSIRRFFRRLEFAIGNICLKNIYLIFFGFRPRELLEQCGDRREEREERSRAQDESGYAAP